MKTIYVYVMSYVDIFYVGHSVSFLLIPSISYTYILNYKRMNEILYINNNNIKNYAMINILKRNKILY